MIINKLTPNITKIITRHTEKYIYKVEKNTNNKVYKTDLGIK